NLDKLTDYEPFQFRKCFSLQPRIRRADGWVLAHQKHAFHFSVEYVVEVLKEGMIAGEFGKEAVAEIISRRCVFPVVRLQRAHEVLWVIRPEAGLFRVVIEIVLKSLVALMRHCQIPGKDVVERRNVSGALDRSVTAQRQNPAARPADVSKQQLQNRSCANDLHALGMLRPTYCIANRGGPLRS